MPGMRKNSGCCLMPRVKMEITSELRTVLSRHACQAYERTLDAFHIAVFCSANRLTLISSLFCTNELLVICKGPIQISQTNRFTARMFEILNAHRRTQSFQHKFMQSSARRFCSRMVRVFKALFHNLTRIFGCW